MNDMKFIYKIPDAEGSLSFELGENTFVPTATSDFLIRGCKLEINHPGTLLDLGCGVGIVGISLKLFNCVTDLYASDLSPDSIEKCEINAKSHYVDIVTKTGNGFEPWLNNKFDYIVDDISGIAEGIAKKSNWFKNVPCDSGVDGTYLVLKIIEEACTYLNPGGKLFFPVISLSNSSKIISKAKENFKNVKKIYANKWFLPEEFDDEMELLKTLQTKGHIDFEFKFGKIICSTDIYVAFN